MEAYEAWIDMVIFRVLACKFSIILRFVEVNLQVDRHLYPAIYTWFTRGP